MRVMPVLWAVAVGVGLGGCATVDDVRSDGVPCVPGVTADRVYIEIAYAGDGTPLPIADCTVRSGTKVTWRTGSGDGRAFELKFKANPDDGTGMGAVVHRGVDFPSKAEEGRQKVKIKAKQVDVSTRFKYDIQANGKRLDPVIIIDPRRSQ